MMAPQQQQQQRQQPLSTSAPLPSTQTQGQMTDLQRILANLPSAQPQQQQQQPEQQQQTSPQEPPSGVMPDIASILANLQPQGNPPATTPLTQQAPQPSVLGMIQDPANLAAILGQFNQGQSNGGVPALSGFGQLGFHGTNSDQQSFTQAPSQGPVYENEERKRWRDNGDEDGGNQGRKWIKKAKTNKGGDNLYTLPCKYWKSGKCIKGSNCTYLHE